MIFGAAIGGQAGGCCATFGSLLAAHVSRGSAFHRLAMRPVLGLALCMFVCAGPAAAATIQVNTQADVMANDGRCSLREAIGAANADAASGGAAGECAAGAGQDVVSVPAGRFALAIPPVPVDTGNDRGDLLITSTLTIDGAGAARTTIDGAGIDSVLSVPAAGVAVLRGLTITGGLSPAGADAAPTTGADAPPPSAGADVTGIFPGGGFDGGGIRNDGRLDLVGVVVTGNRTGDGGDGGAATGGHGGAGVGGMGGSGGKAEGAQGGNAGDGGGIYNTQTLTLESSSVTGNVTGKGGAGGDARGGDGGASSNTVDPTGPAGPPGGDAIGGNGGFAGFGGGITSVGANANVTITNSTISGNQVGTAGAGGRATGGRGGDGGDGEDGGAGGKGGNATAGISQNGSDGGGATIVKGTFVNVTIAGNVAGMGAPGTGAAGGRGGDGGFGGAMGGAGGNGGTGGDATASGGGNAGNGGGMSVAGDFTQVTIASNSVGVAGVGSPPATSEGGSEGPGQGAAGAPGAAGTRTDGPAGATAPAGGLHLLPGATTVRSSIIASNTSGQCDNAVSPGRPDIYFPDATCGPAGANPKLGPLQDNGGPTATMRPEAGSPALDAVLPGLPNCTSSDQRGIARPFGAMCDFGAYEAAPPTIATDPATAVSSSGATLNATVHANQRAAAVRFEYGTTTAYGSSTAARDGGAGPDAAGYAEAVAGLAPNTTYHYRAVATTPDGSATGGDRSFTTTDTIDPVIRSLTMAGSFRAAGRGDAIAAARARIGTTVKYALSEPAAVRFTVERATTGRKVGKTCTKPTRRNRKRKRCTRYVALKGSFRHTGKAGTNSFKFTGRLNNKKLAARKYRLVAVATDAAGNKSAAKRRSFKIVRR